MTAPLFALATLATQAPAGALFALHVAPIVGGAILIVLALALTGIRRIAIGIALVALVIFVAGGVELAMLAERFVRAICL